MNTTETGVTRITYTGYREGLQIDYMFIGGRVGCFVKKEDIDDLLSCMKNPLGENEKLPEEGAIFAIHRVGGVVVQYKDAFFTVHSEDMPKVIEVIEKYKSSDELLKIELSICA